MSIHRIDSCSGTVRCTCGYEVPFTVSVKTDFEELEDLAWDDAGFDEQGFCPSCVQQMAAEDAAGAADRYRKARMEDSL